MGSTIYGGFSVSVHETTTVVYRFHHWSVTCSRVFSVSIIGSLASLRATSFRFPYKTRLHNTLYICMASALLFVIVSLPFRAEDGCVAWLEKY